MKPAFRCIPLCMILLGAWGCVQKSARLQKSVVPPDKTLFETGSNFLKRGQYIRARLTFQNLINTYQDSDLAADAYFAIADSFYEEGGTENLLDAEDQYNNFVVFFPTNPLADDAMLKAIAATMKLERPPDRDPQYSLKALKDCDRFLQQYPNSDYVPIVRQYRGDIAERLAQGNLGVAEFYADKNNAAGEMGRLDTIMKEYPDFSRMDDVYFKYAGILERINRKDEAAIYYAKIVSGWPFSKQFEEAKQRLAELDKPIPAVNEHLAATNEARLKQPEGFLPVRLFSDLGKTLGFVPPPDRYEEAKKAVAEEKIKAAEATGAGSEGSGKGGEILIQRTLRKNASGETQVTDPENKQQENEAKKKVNKNKRQGNKNE